MAIDNNPGGLGGLGGFLGGGGGPAFADVLQAIGHSLMTATDRRTPFANFGQGLQLAQKSAEQRQQREALEALAIQAGFTPDEAKRLAVNPPILKMAMEQRAKQRADEHFGSNPLPAFPGSGGAAQPGPGSPAAAPRPMPQRPAPLSTYADPPASFGFDSEPGGGTGVPSMIGQPMPALNQPLRGAAAVDDTGRDLLIRTVIGEAANEPEEGQAAVAHVALTRLNSGRFGDDIPSVLFAPRQFEPWNTRRQELLSISPNSPAYQRAAQIVDGVLSGNIPDPTQGATHFQNPAVVRQRGNNRGVRWFQDMVNNGSATRIGQHVFGSPDSQPGERVQLASLSGTPASGAIARAVGEPAEAPAPPMPPRRPPSSPTLDEMAPGGLPPDPAGGLIQLAQSSGAMPTGQPPIRNIVPQRMMPGLNAFAPQGANEWRSPTAQTAPPPAPVEAPTITGNARDPYLRQYEKLEQQLSESRRRFPNDPRLKDLERRLDRLKAYVKPTDAELAAIANNLTPGSKDFRAFVAQQTDRRPNEVRVFDEEQRNPEFRRQRDLARRSPELQRFEESQNNPAFRQWLAEQKRDPSLKQRADMLMASGVPEKMAYGLASGRYEVNRHPINGTAQVVDKATGEIVFDGARAEAAPPSASQDGARPASSTPRSSMPRDVDYSTATGGGGALRGIANTIVGAFGGPLPYEEAERASQAMINLQVRTQTALQDAVPGRPSNYLMQQLGKLAVGPNEITMGAARAAERYRQTRDMIRQQLDVLERDVIGNPADYTPAQIAAARLKRNEIADVLRDYDAVLGAFSRPQGRTPGRSSSRAIPPAAIERLRQSPDVRTRQQFDDVFGSGAADRILGGRK
jgi:hypothetical protein